MNINRPLLDGEKMFKNKDYWSCQSTLGVLGFIGMACTYSMTGNLSVTIIPMQKQFNWDGFTQGIILSSTFVGFWISNILGGAASNRFGGRLVMCVGVLGITLSTLLQPLAALHSDALFITARIVLGFSEGIVIPGLTYVIGRWTLPEERSKYNGMVHAGGYFGLVSIFSVGGVLCDSETHVEWPLLFYVAGAIGLLWSVLWLYFVRDSPDEHPRISEWEQLKLQPITELTDEQGIKFIPYKSILGSAPFWGTVAMHFCFSWLHILLLTEMPTYFQEIHHVAISQNGLLSSIPFVGELLFILAYSTLMTYLTKLKKLSILSVRRLSTIIGGYFTSLSLIALCFVGEDPYRATCLLCLAVAMQGANYTGVYCTHVDLSPRFAGTTLGISSGIANIFLFVPPLMTGAVADGNRTRSDWQQVFLISSIITITATTLHLLTLRTEVQPWNFQGTFNQEDSDETFEDSEDSSDVKH